MTELCTKCTGCGEILPAHNSIKAHIFVCEKHEAAQLFEALKQAGLQIEYLSEKFGPTGTGEAVLARIRSAISAAQACIDAGARPITPQQGK